jgi:hypothetical protein
MSFDESALRMPLTSLLQSTHEAVVHLRGGVYQGRQCLVFHCKVFEPLEWAYSRIVGSHTSASPRHPFLERQHTASRLGTQKDRAVL